MRRAPRREAVLFFCQEMFDFGMPLGEFDGNAVRQLRQDGLENRFIAEVAFFDVWIDDTVGVEDSGRCRCQMDGF